MNHAEKHRIRAGVLAAALAAPVALLEAPVALGDDRFESQQLVVNLVPGHLVDEVNQRWNTYTLDAYPEGDLYLLGFSDSLSPDDLDELIETDPAVAWAEPNYIQETPEGIRQMVISATGGGWEDYADQSATERIGLDAAHQATRGAGVLVAVLDTGIDYGHEAFAGRISPDGYDFVDGDPFPSDEANGLDDDGDGSVDEGWGHGTMVAGIISLVAPDAGILPIRVLDDEGRGDVFAIVKAVRYAQLHGARIINMSFGIPVQIDALDEIIDSLDSLDVVVVAGAGNENREEPPYFPASQGKVLMVSALDSLDVKASFSDYHGDVIVSAPGVGIRSAFPVGTWANGSGCSFATPFVTGMAALVESVWPCLGTGQMRERIRLAVHDISGIPGNEPYQGLLGTGRIYLPLAVQGAASVEGAPRPFAPLVSYPNPTRGEVSFASSAGVGPGARGLIFDIGGRLVGVATPRPSAGGYALVWDGREASGAQAAPGVYFAHVAEAGREIARGRFVVAR